MRAALTKKLQASNMFNTTMAPLPPAPTSTQDGRQVSSTIILTIATHFFAVGGYEHLGSLLRRSTWQNQQVIVVVFFDLFPWLTPCHLLTNLVCGPREQGRAQARTYTKL